MNTWLTRKGVIPKLDSHKRTCITRIDAKRRDEAFESDSHAALMYLQSKAYSETNFYCRFSTNEKDMLANIFWRDSHSLFKHQCFGDVLVFDSTYKTNAYIKPLVVFVGVNNHCATCVFGVALLSNETVQSYRWVLNTLMESMGHTHPIYILTDRDKAMRQAIDEIFHNSRHMICEWHVSNNASTHFHKEEKKSSFRYLLYVHLTDDEFEELWNEMLEQHGLEDNNWISRMYEKKHMWAENILRAIFLRACTQLNDVREVDENGVWDSEKHNQPLTSCDCNLFGDDEFSTGIDISRFATLSAECNYLCQNESQTEKGFNLLKKELLVLENTLQGLNDKIRNKAKKNHNDSGPRSHIIKDPKVVKTKGRPSGPTAPSKPSGKP
ncbi:hypothetical protein Dsin_028738 [Dipteronia sinensis]|uniref:MULE transposase domain-containing protein n=1 Tax=Dipteronia sinensis TaxID=43782 RepID=A0AAE0DVU4_9ROSI|nr:hypothetical protein Dsin_028738 [Dipteronia sinensis]